MWNSGIRDIYSLNKGDYLEKSISAKKPSNHMKTLFQVSTSEEFKGFFIGDQFKWKANNGMNILF